MKLEELWKKYGLKRPFNVSALPKDIVNRGTKAEYLAGSIIVSRGEYPDNIYFILEGTVAGIREYSTGNIYDYFRLDNSNGSIGLLEIIAKRKKYIATIVAITKVTILRIDSALIYQTIMEDINLLRMSANILSDDLYKRSGNDGALYYLSGLDRVRYYLTNYYQEHLELKNVKGQVEVNAGYEEIANAIGMSIRTVGRNLHILRESGEIKSNKKRIVLEERQYRKLLNNLYV